MSHRRGAPSVDPECVIRRKWFEEAQRREFRGEDEDDDEEEDDIEEEGQQQEEEEVFAEKDRQEGRSPSPSSRAVSRSKSRTPSRPGTRTFSNFASSLGEESSHRMDRVRSAEKFDKDACLDLDREIPNYDEEDLQRCLQKIADPSSVKAILICCGGFGDNGRMFQEFGAYFEKQSIQVLSFTFPGKLHRVHETPLNSIMDYVDWALATLLHHKIAVRLEKGKRRGVMPDMPPITFFGHDFGGIVCVELIRLLKKSNSAYLPVHHLIASACRPPEVLSEYNNNQKNLKFSKEPIELLLKRYIELGFARPYMVKAGAERKDILKLFLPCFRAEYHALETYNFKRSVGRQGPPLEIDVTVFGGGSDVFAGEHVLSRWRETTSSDFCLELFENAGHFYWKHSERSEEKFLDCIMERLFVVEKFMFDEAFLEGASVVSDESLESATIITQDF